MKKSLTDIVFIIDRSGSMQPLIMDTIGGFNGFVSNQKTLDGEARLTTILFNEYSMRLHDRIDIMEVEPMDKKTYMVGGGTAMLDAIGDAITNEQQKINDANEEDRPERIVFVITTDGQENASRRYRKADIQRMIDHQTKGHGWQFIFLGANMDAVSEASSIGINNAVTYIPDAFGTQTVYNAVDCAVRGVRGDTGEPGLNWCAQVSEYTASKNLKGV